MSGHGSIKNTPTRGYTTFIGAGDVGPCAPMKQSVGEKDCVLSKNIHLLGDFVSRRDQEIVKESNIYIIVGVVK